MEQLFVIIAVVVAAAAALFGVRLLDRAWSATRKRRAQRPGKTHEEIKLPRQRRGH